ncbi:MAG: pantoate--beta-alanine ligase [Legionellales bacterium]|nr:pantoate--beta-alanine ligase [Legionellales bacterium]
MTEMITSMIQWQTMRAQCNASLGFVPTMGNFHAGHLALMQQARQTNEQVVVSVFVNPLQFNDPNDYLHYPRTLTEDFQMATQQGVDYLFAPTHDQLYPKNMMYRIEEQDVSQLLEGAHRPGHFAGMLTIVMKLLQIIKPQRAYFGEKDYQQLQLVRGLVQAFFLETDIVGCPTVRDDSGLPLSSRNRRLSPAGLTVARQFAQMFHQPMKPLLQIKQQLQALPMELEYLIEYEQRRWVATRIEGTRLIDNYTHST